MNPGPITDCWKRTGVWGNHTCPELSRHLHCRNCPTFEQAAQGLLDREPPAGYVEEWTRLLALEKDSDRRLSEVAIVFRIHSEWLALRGACCVEVVSQRPIRRVPLRSNSTLAGLVCVRGEILLCFSLAEPLGLAEEAGPPAAPSQAAPRLIVAGKPRFKFAFRASEVLGLQRYAAEMVETLPATNAHALSRFTQGVLTLAERKIGLLDEERLFHALEKALA